jgi:hypothetical protein
MKKKIYLSAPMTDVEDNNKHELARAQKLWEDMGWDVVNPFLLSEALKEVNKLECLPEPTYFDMLLWDLAELNECDAIGVLPNYKNSFGCQLELAFALKKGLPVYDAFTIVELLPQAQIVIVNAYDKIISKVPLVVEEMANQHG